MEGGRVPPILSLDASSSWANMEIRIQERVGMHRHDDPGPLTPLSPTTSRLPREDMSIYGSVPSADSMQLVVCKWCGRAVKDTAMLRHQELHHPTAKNAPLLLDKIAHPSHTSSRNALVKEQKAERKKKSSRGKDHYDPDRHCGVWLVDEKRNCLRSLTCKYHSLSLRRQVKDRSKPFDELLMLHKEQKRGKSLAQGVVNSQPTIQGAQPVSDNIQVSTLLDSAALPPCQAPPAFAELWVEESDVKRKDSTTTQPSSTGSLSHSSTHPKPLACCKWRTRTVGGGHLLFNRQQDQLYTSLTKLATGNSEDSVSNSMTVAHRKHVFSLLHDEQEKRKSIVSRNNYQLNNFHVPPTNTNVDLLLEGSSRQTHNSKQLFDVRIPNASSSMGESSNFQFPFPKCMTEEPQVTEKRNSMIAPAKVPKTSKKRRRSSSEQNSNSAAHLSSRSNSISMSPFDGLRDMSHPFMSLADIASQATVTMATTITTANHQVHEDCFTFATTVDQHPPVEVNKEDQILPTTPEDFNSMISKMVQQQPQALPLPPPIVFNGMIAGTPGGLIAAMPPQPTAGTVPGNVLSLHSTTPTGLSPQVAQFNPGNMAVGPHQLFPGVIPQANYHESLGDKPSHSTATLQQYLQDRIATGQMINLNQHNPFFVPKQPTSYHPHTFSMLNARRADNSNANCNNISLLQEDSSSNSSSPSESSLEPLLQFATSYSSDDKQSELSLFDSKNINLEQISDQQQVT